MTVEAAFGSSSPSTMLSQAGHTKFAPTPMVELVARFTKLREPVIHGFLRAGEVMNLIASPKVGKSWLAMDIAAAVATGRPWLERFETQKGPVLLIDNELHGETLATRFGWLMRARGISKGEIRDTLDVHVARGLGLTFGGRLEQAIRDFRAKSPKLVILDSFYRLLPEGMDENSNAMMASLYNQLDACASESGAAIINVHHTTKGDQSLRANTDVGAGAGAQSRAADSHIVARSHAEAGVVVLDGNVRSWPQVQRFALRFECPIFRIDEDIDVGAIGRRRSKRRERDVDPQNCRGGERSTKQAPVDVDSLIRGSFKAVGREEMSRGSLCEAIKQEVGSAREAQTQVRRAVEDGLLVEKRRGNQHLLRLAGSPTTPDGDGTGVNGGESGEMKPA